MSAAKEPMAQTIQLQDTQPDDLYTIPRTYGVYELSSSAIHTEKFRFGNHPVRLNELVKEFGECQIYGNILYLNREDAKNQADLLNNGNIV